MQGPNLSSCIPCHIPYQCSPATPAHMPFQGFLMLLQPYSCQSPLTASQLVHLFCDNSAAVGIFQAGKGRDAFLLTCTRDILLTCTLWGITLVVGHILGAQFRDTADVMSRWHLGPVCRDRVSSLIKVRGITLQPVQDHLF